MKDPCLASAFCFKSPLSLLHDSSSSSSLHLVDAHPFLSSFASPSSLLLHYIAHALTPTSTLDDRRLQHNIFYPFIHCFFLICLLARLAASCFILKKCFYTLWPFRSPVPSLPQSVHATYILGLSIYPSIHLSTCPLTHPRLLLAHFPTDRSHHHLLHDPILAHFALHPTLTYFDVHIPITHAAAATVAYCNISLGDFFCSVGVWFAISISYSVCVCVMTHDSLFVVLRRVFWGDEFLIV